MTNDWKIERKKYKLFHETKLGKAFHKFEQSTIRYWQMDSSETISNKRLTELHDAAEQARKEFLTLIMENAS